MLSNEAKNELKTMVLQHLGEICKQVARNEDIPDDLRDEASRFAAEFESLVPYKGRANTAQHLRAEQLIDKIARFLPRLLELHSWPSDSSNL
jgi:hypothetical protein